MDGEKKRGVGTRKKQEHYQGGTSNSCRTGGKKSENTGKKRPKRKKGNKEDTSDDLVARGKRWAKETVPGAKEKGGTGNSEGTWEGSVKREKNNPTQRKQKSEVISAKTKSTPGGGTINREIGTGKKRVSVKKL